MRSGIKSIVKCGTSPGTRGESAGRELSSATWCGTKDQAGTAKQVVTLWESGEVVHCFFSTGRTPYIILHPENKCSLDGKSSLYSIYISPHGQCRASCLMQYSTVPERSLRPGLSGAQCLFGSTPVIITESNSPTQHIWELDD
jgi:hypothetical protein